MRTLCVAAALSLSACSGSFGENVRASFHQAVASGASPIVHVENVAGSVRIEGWAKRTVDIAATKYAHDEDALRAIAIGIRRDGDTITVVTNYAAAVHAGGVRYRISVPADAALQVHNVAGAVDAGRIRGNVDVDTQAGEITVEAGAVTGSRSIDLRATTGAITLVIAPGSNATVVARSTLATSRATFPVFRSGAIT